MERVAAGDQAAFAVLYDRYRAPVWSFLLRHTGGAQAAAEVYQEAFLRVWRSAGTFRQGLAVRPWLWRVVSNTARDRHRRAQRQVQTVDVELELVHGPAHHPIDTADLEAAIGALPDNLREAFLLGAVQGMDHLEVAAALDISPANARARVSRARARLRAALRPDDAAS
jgi:RNA polymerase sigma-70 factor (ECF subfamily)